MWYALYQYAIQLSETAFKLLNECNIFYSYLHNSVIAYHSDMHFTLVVNCYIIKFIMENIRILNCLFGKKYF